MRDPHSVTARRGAYALAVTCALGAGCAQLVGNPSPTDASVDAHVDARAADATTRDVPPRDEPPEPSFTERAARCGGPDRPSAGPLCGPPERPCSVQRDEVVDSRPSFRNGEPALALDPAGSPRVLFARAEGGYEGFYAVRSEERGVGAWSAERMPMPAAGFGLFTEADGSERAVVNNGELPGTTAWQHAADGWTQFAALAPYESYDPDAMILTSGRCLVLGALDRGSGDVPSVVLLDGEGVQARRLFREEDGYSPPLVPGVAVGPSGSVWAAYLMQPRGASRFGLYLARVGEEPAMLEGRYDTFSSYERVRVAVTREGAGERVHVFYAGPSEQGSIVYATRAPGGALQRFVKRREGTHAEDCPPPTQDARCTYGETNYFPEALVASTSGEVRMFFSEERRSGELVGRCGGGPPGMPPVCSWNAEAPPTTSATLHVGWPAGDGFAARALPLPVVGDVSAFARVDAAGAIHLAFYDRAAAQPSDTIARYARIEP